MEISGVVFPGSTRHGEYEPREYSVRDPETKQSREALCFFHREDSRHIERVNGGVAPCGVKLHSPQIAKASGGLATEQQNLFPLHPLHSGRGLGSLVLPGQYLPIMSRFVPALPATSWEPRGCQTEVCGWIECNPALVYMRVRVYGLCR